MKRKALISCAGSAQLICGFVFAYAKSRFSHEAAHMGRHIRNLSLRGFRQVKQKPSGIATQASLIMLMNEVSYFETTKLYFFLSIKR